MAIVFSCPCGRKLQVAEELAGKPVRCPVCFVVTNAAEKPEEPEPPMAQLAPPPPTAVPPRRRLADPRPPVATLPGFARTSGWASASMAVSVVSLFAGVFLLLLVYAWIPGGIAGIVLGIAALFRISASNGQVSGRVRAWFGIVLGVVLLAFSFVLLAIADDVRKFGDGVAGFCEELQKFSNRSGNVH